MSWKRLSDTTPSTLEELESNILDSRGITDKSSFFAPPNPLDLSEEATGLAPETLRVFSKRMQKLKAQQAKVLIFGDYDADGVCATGILWEALHAIGIQAIPFLPDRFKHGYGFSHKALEEILKTGKPDLIITVDNGIVAHQALAAAKKAGIEIILSDHHKQEPTLPAHDLLIHTTKLAGAGIAWMMARELDVHSAENSLDLVAIATVADQVPLLGANRALVWHGLKALVKTKRPGLLALSTVAGIALSTVSEKSIGFGIGPRINAMGRLGSPIEALRLICTKDVKRALLLASVVNDTNVDRQELTNGALALARKQADMQTTDPIVFAHSPEFHEGIIGLIAGSLVETYGKPAVVLADTDTFSKGSARSLPGVSIVDVLRACREQLLEVGGHPMAAGCSVAPDNIEALHTCLLKEMNNHQQVELTREYDLDLPVQLLTPKLATVVAKFAPFGSGNAPILFKIAKNDIGACQAFGKTGSHVKCAVRNAKADIITWRTTVEELERTVEKNDGIVCSLSDRSYQGRVQLIGE